MEEEEDGGRRRRRMEAAPFTVGSDANPGPRKRPRGWWGGGLGTERLTPTICPSTHLKPSAALFSVFPSLCTEQEHHGLDRCASRTHLLVPGQFSQPAVCVYVCVLSCADPAE